MTGERELLLIETAANWLLATPKNLRPRSATVDIMERFHLNPLQACAAIRRYHQMLIAGGANADAT